MIVVFSFFFITALVGAITYYFVRNDQYKTAEDFFLASRGLHWTVVTGSIMLTNLSAKHLVSTNGLGYKEGLVTAGWEVLSAIACALTAIHFLPTFWAAKVATTPEYLKKRFDQRAYTTVCVFFLLGGILEEMPAAVYSGAVAFDQIFDIQKQLGWEGDWGKFAVLSVISWCTGLLGAIYSLVGGLKAVAISDTINGVGLFIAGLSVPILGFSYIGNGNISEGATILYSRNKGKFNMIGGPESTIPYPAIFVGMPVIQMYYWCMQQVVLQRILSARNLRHGQKATVAAGFLKVFVPWIIVLPGIIAFHILREKGIVLSGNSDEAYPALLKIILPEWSMGLYGAVIIGAVLSTFNSNLNTIAQMVTMDIYKVLVEPDASEETLFKVARNVGIACGGFTLCLAPFFMFTPAAYAFLVSVNGLWNAPVVAIFVCATIDFSWFGCRISCNHLRPGAAHACSVVAPIVFTLLRWVLPACFEGATIHSLYVTGIAGISGILTMLVHGMFWPLKEAEVQAMLTLMQKDSDYEILRDSYLEMTEVDSQDADKGSVSDDVDDTPNAYDDPWTWANRGAAFITLLAILQFVWFH